VFVDEEGQFFNIAKEWKRGKLLPCFDPGCGQKGATIGCMVDACKNNYHFACAERTGWDFQDMHFTSFYCKEHRESSLKPGLLPYPPNAVNRNWLLDIEKANDDGAYVPQVGDRVIFFRSAYIDFLGYDPFMSNQQAKEHTFLDCEVLDMEFAFPSKEEYRTIKSIIVTIHLAIKGVSRENRRILNVMQEPVPLELMTKIRRSHAKTSTTDNVIQVKYWRDSKKTDYLVPWHLFERGIKYPELFQEGVDVRAVFATTMYQKTFYETSYGKVIYCLFVGANFPWECLKIQWDGHLGGESSDAVSDLSPWEVLPAAAEPDKNSPRISQEISAALLQELEGVISEDFALDFVEPVDSEIFKDYSSIVPVQMDLQTIKQRLENDYYRQLQAVEFDAKLIYRNCIEYNLPGSDILISAETLLHRMQGLINGLLHPQGRGKQMSPAQISNGKMSNFKKDVCMEVEMDENTPRRSQRCRKISDATMPRLRGSMPGKNLFDD